MFENPLATGKTRPVILIEARGSQWRTLGLTTNPRYRDGGPRVAVPYPYAVGLRKAGWLWGDRLCWVSAIDVENHIGWVDQELARSVASLLRLHGPAADVLVAAAREHHGRDRNTTDSRGTS